MKTLPKITPRQQNILLLLYSWRFLDSNQIQIMLVHKDKARVKKWLKDLLEKHYIEGRYSKTIGKINQPAVYYNSLKSIAYLKTRSDTTDTVISRLYRDNKVTQSFIDQKLLIAAIGIELNQTIKNPHQLATASHLQDPKSSGYFLYELDLVPDLLLVRQTKRGPRAHLIEVLNRHDLKYRLNGYLDLSNSTDWEDHTKIKFPQVIFICPDPRTLVYAKRHLRHYGPADTKAFEFMTVSDVKAEGVAPRLGFLKPK